jgi:hypothetical protein
MPSDAEAYGDIGGVAAKIAGFIQFVRQFQGDQPVRRIRKGERDLLRDMIAQRDLGRCDILEIEAVGACLGAGRAFACRFPVLSQAWADLFGRTRLVRKDIFHGSVEAFGHRLGAGHGAVSYQSPEPSLSASKAGDPTASAGASSALSARSIRGLRSISCSMNCSSSACVNCNRRIDCISWGVITSDCDCLSCSLADSAIRAFVPPGLSRYKSIMPCKNWPVSCLSRSINNSGHLPPG